MTLCDHMFKILFVTLKVEAFHGKSPPCQVGGYWSCANGIVKYLICHVTSPNCVIEAPCNFMCWNTSLDGTILSSVMAIVIVIVEMSLVYHVI